MKLFRPIEAISLYPPELREAQTQLVRVRMDWADKAENNIENLTVAISEIDMLAHSLGLSHGETAAKLEISPATWARLKAGELTSSAFLGAPERPRFQSSTGRAVLHGLRSLCEAWLQASADLRVEGTGTCAELDELLARRTDTPRRRRKSIAIDAVGNPPCAQVKQAASSTEQAGLLKGRQQEPQRGKKDKTVNRTGNSMGAGG